jgi:hypothetical protein
MEPMTTSGHAFRSAFEARFDSLVTAALGEAEWLDEAVDAVTVTLVEVATGAGSPTDAEPRARELAAERRTTRPGSRFLDRHLSPAHDVVRLPLADLAEALDDLDLEPGDAFATPAAAVPLRDGLRDAIGSLVV